MADVKLSQIFGSSGGGTSGYPFFFQTMFGSGKDGDLIASNQSDVGYLGSFGQKEYRNLTIPAGVTWTVAQGSSNGAAMIAVTGTLTLAGSIIANGGNASGGSNGGGTAGGGAGAITAGNGNGSAAGAAASKFGHGAKMGTWDARGGSGASSPFTSGGGISSVAPAFDTTAYTVNAVAFLRRTVGVQQGIMMPIPAPTLGSYASFPLTTVAGAVGGTAAVNTRAQATYGPAATTPVFDLSFIPGGAAGGVGSCTGSGGGIGYGGGGGGGGGVVILEVNRLILTSGYAIQANGGNGGNGGSSNPSCKAPGGDAGCGGTVFIVAREIIGSTSSIVANAGTPGAGDATSSSMSGAAGVAGGVFIIRV